MMEIASTAKNPSNFAADLSIYNARLVLATQVIENGIVLAKGGRIEYAGKSKGVTPKAATAIDANGGWVAPGFIDLHVHGGDGADFMDGTPEAVLCAIGCHARHGTTTIFPTTTTGSPGQIKSMLDSVALVEKQWRPSVGSRPAGVHLYGPFFAPDKVGCHRSEGRRDPDRAEFDRYFRTGLIKIATCAAELPGAKGFYRAAQRRGCLITCGHSNATWKEMEMAFQSGMRHVDHFWCAMSSVVSLRSRLGTPMQASMEQFVLAEPAMSTEVIADGCHLSDELLRFAYQMKGAAKLCLVTDSSRALDQPVGKYRFGNNQDGEWFLHDGKVGRGLDGVGLASSVSGMDQMIRVMLRATKAPLHEVIRMASLTPAELTGMNDELGSLEEGKKADMVLLDSRLRVQRCFIEGIEVDRRKAKRS